MARRRAPEPAEPLSLELRRSFPVSCERLYRCFTEAEHLARWFGPEGVSCRRASVDARPGGSYRIEMENPDGSTAVVAGRFVELDPPRSIRMTWCWERLPEGAGGPEALGEETLVTVRFEPTSDGTLLTLPHERFASEDVRSRHRAGWDGSLDGLAEYLRHRTPAQGEDRR